MLIKLKYKIGDFVLTSQEGAGIIDSINVCVLPDGTINKEYTIKKTRKIFGKFESRYLFADEEEIFSTTKKLLNDLKRKDVFVFPNKEDIKKEIDKIYAENLKDLEGWNESKWKD